MSGDVSTQSNNSMQIDYTTTISPVISHNVDNVTLGAATIFGGSAIKWNVMGVAVLIAGTACGNLLVCIAVCRERSLHNMANYFLMSLAIADLLVSVFVMPIGLTILLFGYFPLSPLMCVVWATLDVLMCTASIWHMCTMSVDRYLTLKYPMRYGRNRTKTTMVFKVTAVWIISISICLPLGVMGLNDHSTVYSNATCTPSARQFVLYGSIMAFYVPLLIMLVTYSLTVRILRRNHRLMGMIAQGSLRMHGTQEQSLADTSQHNQLGINEQTDVRTNSKKIRQMTTRITRLPARSSQETTSVSYVNASSSNTQEPISRVRAINASPCHTSSIANYEGKTLMVTDQNKPSACPTDLQSVSRFHSRNPDLIRCTSSCSPLQRRKRIQRRLKSSLSEQQRHQPLVAANSHPNLQHMTTMETRAGVTLAESVSRPISASDRRQCSSTKSCVASANDLESVMSYMSLSIPLSLDDVSRRPSVVFGVRKCPDMLDRLSQIEAEMDECLTPERINATVGLTDSVGNVANIPSPTDFQFTAPARTLITSVSENRLASSSVSAEFGCRDHRHHSYNELSRTSKQCCTVKQSTGIVRGPTARTKLTNDSLCNQTSCFPQPRRNDGCSTVFRDDDASECALLFDMPCRTVLISAENGVRINVSRNRRPSGECNERLAEKRRHMTCTTEFETTVRYRTLSCAKRKSSVAQTLQRTRSTHSLGPWTTLQVHGLRNRTSTEYEVGKYAPPVVNILSPMFSPEDNTRGHRKTGDMRSPTPRLYKGMTSALTSSADIARLRPNETLIAVDNCDSETSKQSRSPSVSPQMFDNMFLLPNTSLNPSFGADRHRGTTLTISSEFSQRCSSTGSDASGRSRRQQRITAEQRRKAVLSPRLCCWCGESQKPWQRFEFTTLRRVSDTDSSSCDTNFSKRTSRNERKATKVLGIILLAFVMFWTPFFAANLLSAVCPSCIADWLTNDMAASIVWWGYTASLANPVIYTLFSESFRNAFCRVLTCQPRRNDILRRRGNRQHRQLQCAGLTPLGGGSQNPRLSRSQLNSGTIPSERPSSIVAPR